jgi:hypothetical protein
MPGVVEGARLGAVAEEVRVGVEAPFVVVFFTVFFFLSGASALDKVGDGRLPRLGVVALDVIPRDGFFALGKGMPLTIDDCAGGATTDIMLGVSLRFAWFGLMIVPTESLLDEATI